MTPEEKIAEIKTHMGIAEALQARREAIPPPRPEDESATEYLIRTCDCEECQPRDCADDGFSPSQSPHLNREKFEGAAKQLIEHVARLGLQPGKDHPGLSRFENVSARALSHAAKLLLKYPPPHPVVGYKDLYMAMGVVNGELMRDPTPWPLFLLRHGESAANAGERTVDADPAQIPLTDKGKKQAEFASLAFENSPPHLIVCSPMLRAKQTAAPLVEMFPDAVFEEWPIHELTYLSPERCRNTTSADRKPMAEAYRQRNDPDWVEGPGSESFNQFLTRVEDAAIKIQGCRQKTVIMVGHNQFFTALLHRLERGQMPTMEAFWKLADGNMGNGEVRKVTPP